MTSTPRPVFVLRLEGPPGQAGIHRLRALLKRLLRDGGFRCLDAVEHTPDEKTP
jgi:hypothetical protein